MSTKLNVAIVGYRGMVGTVLVDRMIQEKDFDLVNARFFSTSTYGEDAPEIGGYNFGKIGNAKDINELATFDVIITCQGGDYTNEFYPQLRAAGWQGYWIDAASALRMKDGVELILDPINGDNLRTALANGTKTFAGANCTVSLMLMALSGLFKRGLVESAIVSSYQAASGAGAANMRELLEQFGELYDEVRKDLEGKQRVNMLEVAAKVQDKLQELPAPHFGAPLAASLIPWIDAPYEDGFTKEEWKGHAETNKILGLEPGSIKIDSTCVRVGVLRSHSQSITLKLTQDLPLETLESYIKEANQ